jgi:hypothetical protein
VEQKRMPIPSDPETLLTRPQLAEALTFARLQIKDESNVADEVRHLLRVVVPEWR